MPIPKLQRVCRPRKFQRAIPLANTATESSTFQQVDLPGVLMSSEAPGGEGRSARGTNIVRSPWWRGRANKIKNIFKINT